jgi:glycosyltransferase involved in cell wall biosynthesis
MNSMADFQSRPGVTIVTPSYNQGPFLRRTIESVLSQGYPNLHYVVIDGGSTDDSVEILKSYGDRIQWVSEPDRGQSHAINKGFTLAGGRGEIWAYLNSDDTLHPGAVQRVVACFAENPDWDLIYGLANYVDENDRVIMPYPTDEYSFARLCRNCMICQPAAFWTRRIARRVGPFDERLHYTMDYDYWFRIALAGGIIRHIPELLANSRLYDQAKSLASRGKMYEEAITTSRRHTGRVSVDFFTGLWHHRLHERPTRWNYPIRRFPNSYLRIAQVHHWLAG